MLKDKTHYYAKKNMRYRHWCKENKINRKIWQHKHRVAVRNAMDSGDYENVPQYKASGGILTW